MSETVNPITQRIMARLVGAELPLVEIEVRAAISDFLARALCWRETVELEAVAGQRDYALAPPQPLAGIVATRLFQAYYGERRMRVLSLSASDDTTEGDPGFADLSNPMWVRVWPKPKADTPLSTIRLHLAWGLDNTIINPDAVILPQTMLGHLQTITDGALANLFGMPDKPWSNTMYSGIHATKYRQGVMEARRAAEDGRGRESGQNWKFPHFA